MGASFGWVWLDWHNRRHGGDVALCRNVVCCVVGEEYRRALWGSR